MASDEKDSIKIKKVHEVLLESRNSKESIKEADEKYESLFNTIPSGVAVYKAVDCGEDFVFVDFNQTAERIEGVSKSDLIGKRVTEVFPGVKKLGLLSVFQRVYSTSQREFLPSGIYLDQRILSWRENWVYKLPSGNVVAVYNDVTERKKAEEALRESEEKFRTIANSTKDALVVVDNYGKVVLWNPAAEKIFGNKKIEVLGRDVTELLMAALTREEDKKIVKAGFDGFTETGKGVLVGKTIELVAKRKNGVKFPFKLSVTAMHLNDKWYAVALARDITEQKQLWKKVETYSKGLELTVEARTRELRQTHERLLKVERLATIGELAGMVGHDLRNPLTSIKTAAYYLRVNQDPNLNVATKKMLTIIDDAIAHADKIIGDLQEYAREIRLDRVPCSVQSILREALFYVEIPVNVKIVDASLEDIEVNVDRVKMERVFINLIKNAVDAMPNGGILQVGSKRVNGTVEISFADTGTGISKDLLNKLFSPLFTTKAKGMGFGLAICKRVAEAHQGKISVQSVEGKGTTFTLTLPVEDEPEKIFVNQPETLSCITNFPA